MFRYIRYLIRCKKLKPLFKTFRHKKPQQITAPRQIFWMPRFALHYLNNDFSEFIQIGFVYTFWKLSLRGLINFLPPKITSFNIILIQILAFCSNKMFIKYISHRYLTLEVLTILRRRNDWSLCTHCNFSISFIRFYFFQHKININICTHKAIYLTYFTYTYFFKTPNYDALSNLFFFFDKNLIQPS